jgi:hypothetical protein
MNTAPKFSEFPASYRYSQLGVFLSVCSLFFGRQLFRGMIPMDVKRLILSTVGLVVLFSLLLSCYVIIRYPYLSLIEPDDGDLYSRFVRARRWMLKFLGVSTSVSLVLLSVMQFLVSKTWSWWPLYGLTLALFVIFLTFFYRSEYYPTIATFLRATLGAGIFFFPLFIPVLLIGSFRCQRLLNEFADRDQFGETSVSRSPG